MVLNYYYQRNIMKLKYKSGQVLKVGNIADLILDDLVDWLKNDPIQSKEDIPFKKWEGMKSLYVHDKVSHLPVGLHEIHSIYSISGFKISIDKYKDRYYKSKGLISYPAKIKFDMTLTDKAQPILEYLKMDHAFLKTTYQSPEAMYPMHLDRANSNLYNKGLLAFVSTPTNSIKNKLVRFYIFLEDWKQGQFLFANDSVLQWKKGDIYCWDDTVLHGSANVGLHPKIGLTITGPHK